MLLCLCLSIPDLSNLIGPESNSSLAKYFSAGKVFTLENLLTNEIVNQVLALHESNRLLKHWLT